MSSSSGLESVRPYSPAPPLEQDFIRQQIAKQQKGNFHSTSLKMVSSVNKTALHPGGVQPQREHTEIEEELHEKAHIDYDRVAIVSCIEQFLFPVPLLTMLRLPTPRLQPFTRMPSSTKPVQPSHLLELFQHTQEQRLAVRPQTSVSCASPAQRKRSGGVP